MDADVISIENSKSDAKLLAAFEKGGYNNWIGPGNNLIICFIKIFKLVTFYLINTIKIKTFM